MHAYWMLSFFKSGWYPSPPLPSPSLALTFDSLFSLMSSTKLFLLILDVLVSAVDVTPVLRLLYFPAAIVHVAFFRRLFAAVDLFLFLPPIYCCDCFYR